MHIELGDVVTFNFEYDGHPPGTNFVADSLHASSCTINGIPAALAWHFKPIPKEWAAGVGPSEGAD